MGDADSGSDVPLVGRAAELQTLCHVVDHVRRSGMRVVLIEGEAGIGKTRLLNETLRHAECAGVRVLVGACDAMERDRPMRAISDALGARYAGDITAPLAGAIDPAWLVVDSVLDDFEELATSDPLVLAIEDLQWADPLTLRTVHAMTRRLCRLPFVLLATVRRGSLSDEVGRVIDGLLASGAQRVDVGPLGADEAAELAGEVAGCRPAPGLLQQLDGAAGNPLFVIEVVRAFRENLGPAWPPPTLRLTLLRRLSQFPEDGVNLLRLASILGSTFSVTELSLLAERSPVELLPALTAAVQAGLLIDDGDRLSFHHELVRDALYHDLPAALRRSLHRQAGAVLANGGAPLERVASHVALGATRGDVEALRWLQTTARRAAPHAPSTAIVLLERAREIVDEGDPFGDEIAADMVAPLLTLGRLSDAESLARKVLAVGADRRADSMVRNNLISALSMQARYPEAIGELEVAVARAAEPERLVLEGTRALLMVLAGHPEEAREGGSRVVGAAEITDNDHALCLGLQTLAMVALAEGSVADAVSRAERATVVLERGEGEWTHYLVPHLWHGTALADGDQFGAAEAALVAGLKRANRSANVSRVPLYHWALAEVRLASGQWDDAVTEAEAGLALVAETQINQVGDVFAHALRAHVALHRGDLTLAEATASEAERRVVGGPVEIGFEWMAWVRALLLEGRGQRAHALERLATTWDLIAPVRYLQAMSRAMAPDLVRLAVAEGDRERAASVTLEMERSAERTGSPTARGLALRCRGLLEGDVDVLLLAVAAHRQGPRPFALAAACEDAGDACRPSDRATDAVRLLGEAEAIYAGLDAVWDLDRVHAKLRALGARRVRRRPVRPRFGWEALTPTERRVVDLVAEGFTNREVAERMFVSRRTIATHVEHVLQKLGHANRVELTADHARRAVRGQVAPAGRTGP